MSHSASAQTATPGPAAAGALLATAEREPGPSSVPELLAIQRDRAERLLNGIRAVVLLLLASAAVVYAPTLTPELNRVNVLVLVPTLAWTLAQYFSFYHRPKLPAWLASANPIVDLTAVTVLIGGYAAAQSAVLALRAPMFLAYFVILAAQPITSSARKAAAIAGLAVAEYLALLTYLMASGGVPVVISPLAAAEAPGVSLLDEGAKLLLLAVAGAVATYATHSHERFVLRYSRASHEGERLEARLAEARLQSLKLQLHPHFLFNTLNTITALITVDPRAAERMVSGLSDLLRLSLRNVGEQEVPLARELEILEHYLQIQQIRFRDRLRVSLDIEPAARSALVPNLLLQPLVENAIRHGIAPRAAPGHIRIQAAVRDATLELDVVDDGVGDRSPGVRVEGVGLGNTRVRLRSLYGARHRFEAGGGDGGGFAVRIAIPFRSGSASPGNPAADFSETAAAAVATPPQSPPPALPEPV